MPLLLSPPIVRPPPSPVRPPPEVGGFRPPPGGWGRFPRPGGDPLSNPAADWVAGLIRSGLKRLLCWIRPDLCGEKKPALINGLYGAGDDTALYRINFDYRNSTSEPFDINDPPVWDTAWRELGWNTWVSAGGINSIMVFYRNSGFALKTAQGFDVRQYNGFFGWLPFGGTTGIRLQALTAGGTGVSFCPALFGSQYRYLEVKNFRFRKIDDTPTVEEPEPDEKRRPVRVIGYGNRPATPPSTIPRPRFYPPGTPVPYPRERRRKPPPPSIPPPAKEPEKKPKEKPKTPPPPVIVPSPRPPSRPPSPPPERPPSPPPVRRPFPPPLAPPSRPFPRPSRPVDPRKKPFVPPLPVIPPPLPAPDRPPNRENPPLPRPPGYPVPSPVPTPLPPPRPVPVPTPRPVPVPLPVPIPTPSPFPVPKPPITIRPPIVPTPVPPPVPLPFPIDRPTPSPIPNPPPPGEDMPKCCPPDVDCSKLLKEIKAVRALLEESFSGSLDLLKCGDSDPTSYSYSGAGLKGVIDQIKAVSRIVNDVNQSVCDVEAVAAYPVHWNSPLGAGASQLICMLAPEENGKLGRANSSLVIPDWDKTYDETRSSFSLSIPKGRFYSIMKLSSGRKICAYCVSESAAQSLFEYIADYLDLPTGSYTWRSTEVHGSIGVRTGTFYLKYAKYYAAGRSQLEPTWQIDFTRDPPA